MENYTDTTLKIKDIFRLKSLPNTNDITKRYDLFLYYKHMARLEIKGTTLTYYPTPDKKTLTHSERKHIFNLVPDISKTLGITISNVVPGYKTNNDPRLAQNALLLAKRNQTR